MPKVSFTKDVRNAEKQKSIRCMSCGDNIPVGTAVFHLTSSYHAHCYAKRATIIPKRDELSSLAPVVMHWWQLIREAGLIKKSTDEGYDRNRY